jgi:hypothetical protein
MTIWNVFEQVAKLVDPAPLGEKAISEDVDESFPQCLGAINDC